MVINVKSINQEEPKESRCFHFWAIKHPMCLMWLFIIFMLLLSIGISQLYK